MNSPSDREEELFAAALELSGTERKAFLEQLETQDPELRRRLESLLNAFSGDQQFLENAAAEAATLSVPAEAHVGETLGRYRLVERLGEGGWGVVFRAEQVEPMRRDVALKILKFGMDTRALIARFDVERQALALMDHPGIARVFDAGTTPGGRPFVVMELIRGPRVTDFCDQHRLNPRQRLELFIQICEAVQHAHQKGVIHRDLKPSNILVTGTPDKPQPKIIDFGIAKATETPLTSHTALTELSAVLGTPAYMSPEQATFDRRDVDTRSDLYSLGVLLYELLTGRPPFDSGELLKAGVEEVFRRLRETDPPRPSTRLGTLTQMELAATAERRASEPPRLLGAVRGDLDWIVMRALEKARDRRYATANDFAADLQRHLRDEPVEARPPSRVYLAGRFIRRHRAPLAVAAALFLTLATGLATSLWQLRRAVHAEATSEQRRLETERQAGIARAINSFLTKDILAAASPRNLGRDVTVRRALEVASTNLANRFTNEPAIQASLHDALGETFRTLGVATNAEFHLNRALELQRAALGPEHPDTLKTQDHLITLWLDQERIQWAEPIIRQQWEIRRRTLGPDDPATLISQSNLLIALLALQRPKEALPLGQELLAIRQRRLGDSHPETVTARARMARIYEVSGDLAEAEVWWHRALTNSMAVHGPRHPQSLVLRNNLASLLQDRGQLVRAEELLREVLNIGREVLGPDHFDLAMNWNNFGSVLEAQGNYAEAGTAYEESLRIRILAFGTNSARTATAYHNLGTLRSSERRLPEAATHLLQAIEIRRRTVGPTNLMVARAEVQMASVQLQLGNLPAAGQWIRPALAQHRSQLTAQDHRVGWALSIYARILLAEGQTDDAVVAAQESVTILTPVTTDNRLVEAQAVLGAALSQLANPSAEQQSEARRLLELTTQSAVVRPRWQQQRNWEDLAKFLERFGTPAEADRAREQARLLADG